MHALSFKIKRVHHRILSYGRFLLRGLEAATPARFDLLYALEQRNGSMPQRELLDMLGVHATTLSKMLKRLEQLGLVVRSTRYHDKRTKKVELTNAGLDLIRRAIAHIFRWDAMQLVFECFFGGETFQNFLRVDQLISTMSNLALHLRDRAQLEYPTDHPDD